jgi:hypothetical protein
MRSSHFLAFCLFLAGAAQAQDLNVITAVEVKDEGNSVLVTVRGSKPPNFTTFSMADPARFVIDLSEAKFQGVPEDLRVDDGVVRVVKNLSYGTGATSIARVMVAFSVDVEPPDVQTDGNALLVKVSKPGVAAVASADAKPAVAAPAAAAPAADAAPAAAATPAAADGADAGVVVAEAPPSDADDAARKEALASEQREAEAREQARQSAEASAKEREAQARLEREALARQAEQVAAKKAEEEEEARRAAEARNAEIKAKAAEASEPQQAAAAEPAAAPVAVATPVQAAEPEPTPAQAEAPVRAPTPDPAPTPAETRAAAASSAPAPATRLQAIGFKQLATVSRVFVKTSATPRFTITDVGDDVVRVEVENTRSTRRNDTRPLDTSFFPSAVSMITPSKKGTSYVVDIKLKKRVPYQQKVEGDLLAIDFERPPADAGAAAAAAAAGPGPAPKAAADVEQDNAQGLVVAPDEPAEGEAPAADAEQATEPAAKQ